MTQHGNNKYTKLELSPIPPGSRGHEVFTEVEHTPQSPGRHPGLRDRLAAQTYTAMYGLPTKLDESHVIGSQNAPRATVIDGRGGGLLPHTKHRSPSPPRPSASTHLHAHNQAQSTIRNRRHLAKQHYATRRPSTVHHHLIQKLENLDFQNFHNFQNFQSF